jgi:hypothetical protein
VASRIDNIRQSCPGAAHVVPFGRADQGLGELSAPSRALNVGTPHGACQFLQEPSGSYGDQFSHGWGVGTSVCASGDAGCIIAERRVSERASITRRFFDPVLQGQGDSSTGTGFIGPLGGVVEFA